MKEKKRHGHGKHMIIMLLGCLVLLIAIGALKYFNVGLNGLARYSGLLFLACPLMHIFMMGHGKESHHEE